MIFLKLIESFKYMKCCAILLASFSLDEQVYTGFLCVPGPQGLLLLWEYVTHKFRTLSSCFDYINAVLGCV